MTLKPLLIFPPLALGIAGFMWMTQPQSTQAEQHSPAKLAVRAITLSQEPLTLTATGYGRVEALRSWNAVSQAEGRVTQAFAGLAIGAVVEQGDVLIQIDPTDYEIAIAKTQANIAAATAALSELTRQEENTRRLLDVEQRILDVAQAEFDRIKRLSNSGTVTSATFDTAQKTLLNQENAVINRTNTLALYPTQRASAEATLAVREAELAETKRSLANTTINAPFRGRISAKSVAQGQFVRLGSELLTLEAIDQAEVVGAFQPRVFGSLLQGAVGPHLQNMSEVDATRVIDYMTEGGITATVTLGFADSVSRYPATPTRFRGSVDSETGTFGIAVRVDDPLVANTQNNRPPLEFGSFVSVVLEATPETPVIAIPRAILQHDDLGAPFVYTATPEGTLALTPVTPGPVAGDRILIAQGLQPGDTILLSAPRPSVPGIALDIVIEDEARP